MKIYIWIHLLCILTTINGNIIGYLDSNHEKNRTIYKFIVHNQENQNYVCIIAETKLILVINNELLNISKEVTVGLNSSLSGNCSVFHRELVIVNEEIEIVLNWLREPDPYEFGEVGWSSVGAPANTTSGTYTLSKIELRLPISWLTNQYIDDFKVHFENSDHERFKTRSGDYYVCETRIAFDMVLLNTSLFLNSSLVNVKLELENTKMQAFSDLNVTDFTGTGQICPNDLPPDSGVSIGIGVAVSVLVVAVLAFLAIGRLKEKDQQYQEIDTSKWIPQKS